MTKVRIADRWCRRCGACPRLGVALLLAGTALVACGDDDDDDGASSSASESSSAADRPPADEGAFPVTIEHVYGSAEIPETPERVVTLGLSDQDPVLALGIVPIAVTDWYGDYEYATWPWAQDELGDGQPTVLADGEFTGTQEFNYEEIAGLQPDLILGLWAGVTEEQYDTLSEIAPTVVQPDDFVAYGMPWQETTRVTGRALGREERAEELIAEVEAAFAEAREQHPEFAGLSAIVAERDPGTAASWARGPQDPRTRFMTSLGFEHPEDIAELSGDEDGTEVSDENFDLLDRDVLMWNIGTVPEVRGELEANPIYQQLAVASEGRVLFVDDQVTAGALTWNTVLSIPYAIDELVPQLAEIVRQ
jgi:iron complex transport system substrate-binding protein